MRFKIRFANLADEQMDALEIDKSKKGILKQVNKVLGYMETNLKHPSLNTHKFDQIESPFGGDVFENLMPKIKRLEPIESFGLMAQIKQKSRYWQLHRTLNPFFKFIQNFGHHDFPHFCKCS